LVDDRCPSKGRSVENQPVLSQNGSQGNPMNNKLNAKERLHLARVKMLPCSVCDKSGPSEAHHYKQGLQYTCIALCQDCHTNSILGWHGQKRMWHIKKMDEIDALNNTIKRLLENPPENNNAF
jgi:hypothetical protein